MIVYCPNDQQVMTPTWSGKIQYVCPVCKETVDGTDADARVTGKVLGAGQVVQRYDRMISVSAWDPTAARVMRDCSGCGLDYMTRLRVGDDQITIYTCTCGKREEAPRAAIGGQGDVKDALATVPATKEQPGTTAAVVPPTAAVGTAHISLADAAEKQEPKAPAVDVASFLESIVAAEETEPPTA